MRLHPSHTQNGEESGRAVTEMMLSRSTITSCVV